MPPTRHLVEVRLLALTSDPLLCWSKAATAMGVPPGDDELLSVAVVDVEDPANWTEEQVAAVLADADLASEFTNGGERR